MVHAGKLRRLRHRADKLELKLQKLAALPPKATATPYDALPLLEWGQAFFKKHLKAEPSSFHREFCADLDATAGKRGWKMNRLAPRGSAKSTWGSLIFPMRKIMERSEEFIVIESDTIEQAKYFLIGIRDELENNEELAAAYPHACGIGRIWNDKHIRTRNTVDLMALGTGGKIRGRKNRGFRPSLVIVDDPENKDHISSRLRRSRSWAWLTKDVLSAGDPRTNFLVMGTALHHECMVYRLLTEAGWQSKTYRSLLEDPKRLDLWQQWKDILFDYDLPDPPATARAFFDENIAEMDEPDIVLWPAWEPLYDLMLNMASAGVAAFNSEKQNNPTDPTQSEWPEEYFTRANFWFDEWPEDHIVKAISIDPSKGARDKVGDYCAVVKLSVDKAGIEYVEARLFRGDTAAIVQQVQDDVRDFQPEVVAFEANQFQSLLAPPIERALADISSESRVIPLDNHEPKIVRIRRLTKPLASRLCRFKRKSPGTVMLVDQLKAFPAGDFDDGPDALEMARRVALQLVATRSNPKPQGFRYTT